MSQDYTIIGGDLNFSLGTTKSWGFRGQSDHLTTFFENLLDAHDFLNIDPIKLKPTLRNRRLGEDALARRLD